ncbi:MAG TPA: hypothetical protein VFR11_10580 [Micromonosporaceae bacterium]|jgi:hypothetical protein|nr:hypothetical protein [Micromonosporaceae bacterium]
MPATTIKVPSELRDRLAAVAKREHTTLAGAIARSLDAAEEAAFWSDVAARMDSERGASRASDVSVLDATLTDGLDPNETWDDIW